MRHVGFANRAVQERTEISAGEIDFYSDRLPFDKRPDAAQQIETLGQCRPDLRTISSAGNDGDPRVSAARSRSRRVLFFGGRGAANELDSKWRDCRQS